MGTTQHLMCMYKSPSLHLSATLFLASAASRPSVPAPQLLLHCRPYSTGSSNFGTLKFSNVQRQHHNVIIPFRYRIGAEEGENCPPVSAEAAAAATATATVQKTYIWGVSAEALALSSPWSWSSCSPLLSGKCSW